MNLHTAHGIRTTCPYCGVGCGVLAQRDDGAEVSVHGDPQHPANAGRLCTKGHALGQTVGLEDRLLHPQIGDRRVDWDTALDAVAQGFLRTIERHGPDSVAFYVSGQLLTEDYYVANKLMKGFIGSANIDTNSRLCMSSAVMGHKRAFGADLVPGCYEDLEIADLVVLVGSNAAWCHPVLFRRLCDARAARPQMKLVVIDPRRTATCEQADLHLALRPGSDAVLFNGLLAHLAAAGHGDRNFIESHTDGLAQALAAARASAPDLRTVATLCGLSPTDVKVFFEWFASTEAVVTAWSQGVNQSSSGTDKVNALINCHLLTGRIGKPGAGPFSLTGQPNAMGGREVGGMATTLAAHTELGDARDAALVQSFWGSPRIAPRAGLRAVEMFEAVRAGRVKALWIMATNPVVSLPDADAARAALAACDLVVVSDFAADTDTLRHAHIRLPVLAWGEKDGTVTNSERRISRQRAFLPAPGEARADWQVICEVAARMGFTEAFRYAGPHEIFDEHARLSAHGNDGARVFDIGGLAGLTREAYDSLQPVQWPVRAGGAGTSRLFTDARFQTPQGRAQFVAVQPRPPANRTKDLYPLVLNTGRIRDQWHTMTRSGRSPRLSAHLPEPFIQVHPHTALACGVADASLGRVRGLLGEIVARVVCTSEVPPGMLFVPIHWNATTASDARVGTLIPAIVDPVSGEPEFKHAPAQLEPFPAAWYGFALSRKPLAVQRHCYWVRATGERFLRYELAGRDRIEDWSAWGRSQLGAEDPEADWLEVCDPATGLYRAAHLVDGRMQACVFGSPRHDLPSRAWLSGLFLRDRLDTPERIGLLAGLPPNPDADTGPTVCSCFGVGRNSILRAVRAGGLQSPHEVGESLQAGTNCGSCVPEIQRLIREAGDADGEGNRRHRVLDRASQDQ